MHKTTANKVVACLSLLCSAQLMGPYAVWAAGINLNLASPAKTVHASSLTGFQPTNIVVGGSRHAVTAGSMLTPAEAQAVLQVLNSGHQSLTLNALGAATGGSLVVNQTSAGVSGMVVPSHVSLVDNVLNQTSSISVAGNLRNAGSLLLSAPGADSLSLTAWSITNTGLISSLQAGMGLNLSATLGAIKNSGTISSAGDLSLTAKTGIINSAGAVVQAADSLNLSSKNGVYKNFGSMIATTGDINVINPSATQPLNYFGTGGTLQALLGNINFRDASYAGKGNINLTGGDFFSNAVNLFAGCGLATGNVGDVTGTVNITARDARFNADAANLKMGDWIVSDDPMLTNTGNVSITGLLPVSGSDFLVIAGGNITGSSTSINTSSSTTNGGNVVLVAGAAFNKGTITGASSSGGDISLPSLTSINSSSTAPGFSAGNVSLIAFPNNTNTSGGHINLAPTNTITATALAGKGSNGVVQIVGGAKSNSAASTIVVGDIATGGSSVTGGAVTISTSLPNATVANPVVLNTSTAAIIKGSFLGGANQAGTVTAGDLSTNGQPVNVTAGTNSGGTGAITLGQVNTSASGRSGGAVTIKGGVVAAGGTNGADVSIESINTSSDGANLSGGAATVSSTGAVTFTNAAGMSVTTAGTNGANGGNVYLLAGGAGGSDLSFKGINSSGANAGNVQLLASRDVLSANPGGSQVVASGTNNGGNVAIVAGGLYATGTNTTVNGPSSSGGNVTFSGTNWNIDTDGVNSGNVTVVAYANGANRGAINLPNSVQVFSSGISGDVSMYAGAQSAIAVPTTLNTQLIDTSNSTQGGGGNITLATLQPANNVSLSPTGVVTGSNTFAGNIPVYVNGTVSAPSIFTSGGDVSITAGRALGGGTTAITVGSINTAATSGVLSSNGGAISLRSAAAGGTANADIAVTGGVITVGFGSQGLGGSFTAITPSSINMPNAVINTGDAASSLTLAKAGHVVLKAGTGSSLGAITFKQISAIGANGGAVQMIASGDITSSQANPITTKESGTVTNEGSAGNVLLAAGAVAAIGTTTISITGPSGFGGTINLTSPAGNSITTSVNGTNGAGGNVTLLAFRNTLATAGGLITVAGGINTSATITGSPYLISTLNGINYNGGSGSVLAVADGLNSTATGGYSINLAAINTAGTVTGTGSVAMSTSTPNTAAGPLVFNTASGTVVSGSALGGLARDGAVTVSSITTAGGNVQIQSGSNATTGYGVDIGNITTTASTVSYGNGGPVIIYSGLAGTAANADVKTLDITTLGYTQSLVVGNVVPPNATGGLVAITTPGSIQVANVTTGNDASADVVGGPAGASGANGGNVLMLAGSATDAGTITFGNISTKGGSTVNNQATGAGGSVGLVSLGTSGAGTISGTSIRTDSISALTNGIAGAVTLSSYLGAINVSTISVNADRSNAGGDIFISSGLAGAQAVSVSTINYPVTAQVAFVFIPTTSTAAVPGTMALTTKTTNMAMPGGTHTLSFNVGAASTVVWDGNVANPVLFSPGGYTAANSTFDLVLAGDQRLVVPLVSVSGIALTGSNSLQTSTPLLLAASSIDLRGSLTNASPISSISTGSINYASTPYPTDASKALNVGTVVSAQSFSASLQGNIVLWGPIAAPSVSLSARSNLGYGGSLLYANNVAQPIITSNLSLQSTSGIGLANVPFQLVGPSDAITLNDTIAGSIYLQVQNTNLFINNMATTTTINDITTGLPIINVSGNIEVINANGSITLDGVIDAPNGSILFLAGANLTSGPSGNLQITSNGRTAAQGHPSGGNLIYLLAGADSFYINNSTGLAIPTRSGRGGDINLSGLTTLTAFTDFQGSGGQITMVAFAQTADGHNGGTVTLPSNLTFGIYNPPFSSPGVTGSGVTIVAEASGGESPSTTVSVGNIYAGSGSITIYTAKTPTTVNTPVVLNVANLGYATADRFDKGQIQPNASVVTGNLDVLGVVQSSSPSNAQGITIYAGGTLTTGDIVTLGSSGWTPQPLTSGGFVFVNPLIPSSLNGFSGGAGAPVVLSANFDVFVNGGVSTFGGGGAGGLGAPFNNIGTAVPAQIAGGAGGNGGSGGNVQISSTLGSVQILSGINTSGGGGGGGGGGFGGQGNAQVGGPGGFGGAAGFINITASSAPGETISVNGPVYAVAGGNGGNGGEGLAFNNNGFGGSGGGGGGSYGSGGGGGGGGVHQPQGAALSGFGGAGGGGIFGGGGGDVQNVNINKPTTGLVTYTGYGGWGGGGFLADPVFSPGGVYGGGPAGGANNNNAIYNGATLQYSSNPGVAFQGGNGGTYNNQGYDGTGPGLTLVKPAAIGGILGGGGAGGANGNAGSPELAGKNGSDVLHRNNYDGVISFTANGFTAPTTILGGSINLVAGKDANTQGSGTLIVGGNMVATGFYNPPGISCQGCNGPGTFTAIVKGTTTGDVVVSPNTTINVYDGKIQIENDNASGHITIGSNSLIFDAGNGTGSVVISMGQPTWQQNNPVAPVLGKAPAGVQVVSQTLSVPPNNMFFGNAGFTVTGGKATLLALGQNALVEFQSGWFTGTGTFGNSKSIQIQGGVQIGAQSGLPLTSLDLTNSNVVQTIAQYQQLKIIGGQMLYTAVGGKYLVHGGTIVLYPLNLTNTLSAMSIPVGDQKPLSVTMSNFAVNNPITVSITASSTTQTVDINSPLIYNGTVAVNGVLNVVSNLTPTFTVGPKGSITSTGSLSISTPGVLTLNGPVSAAGTVSLTQTVANSNPLLPSFDVQANVNGTKGLTLSSVGILNIGSGTTSSTAVLDLIASKLTFGTGKIVDTTGTVIIEPINSAQLITVGIGGAFNINSTMLLAIKAKTVQFGSQADTGGITVNNPLNVTSAVAGVGVGLFGLDFENQGNINFTGGSGLTLGKQNLTVNSSANTASLDFINGGGVVKITGQNGLSFASGVAGTTTTLITLSAPNGSIATVSGGFNGKSLTVGDKIGATTNISTNATILAFTGGDATISDSAVGVTLNASTGGTINISDVTDKSKLTIAGALNVANFTANVGGATAGSIAVNANINSTNNVTLAVTGTGTVTDTAKTLITAPGVFTVSSNKGALGTAGVKLNVLSPTVNATTLGSAFIADNSNAVTVNADLGALTITSTGNGVTVNNNSNNAFILNPSSSNGTFQLLTPVGKTGSVTVLGITVNAPSSDPNAGGIRIISSDPAAGAININGNLTDVGGATSGYAILVQSKNTGSGAINIRGGAKLTTNTTGPANPNSQIAIVIDTVINTGSAQGSLAGFTITGSGSVFLNGTPPTVTGTALIKLTGSNVLFDTTGSGHINVGSGALFQPQAVGNTSVIHAGDEVVVDSADDTEDADFLVSAP